MAVNLEQIRKTTKSREAKVTPAKAAVGGRNLFKWVLVGLAISAVLELVLWRTFSRIGVFIPKTSTVFQTVYTIGSNLGRIMLNVAVILGVAFLVMAVGRLRGMGRFGQRESSKGQAFNRSRPLTLAILATGIALTIAFVQLFPKSEVPLLSLFLRLALIVAFVALAVDYWQGHRHPLARLFIGLMTGAYVIQLVAKIGLDYLVPLTNSAELRDAYIPMVVAGEALVLVNGIVLYLLYGGGQAHPVRSLVRNWPAFVGAFVLTAAFVGLTFLTVAESDIVPILGLYALGYTMQLPLALYVIALFFLLYTVFYNLGHLRQGRFERSAAFGLLLIFCGGYLFNISNQYLFALAGVLLLTRPELVESWQRGPEVVGDN